MRFNLHLAQHVTRIKKKYNKDQIHYTCNEKRTLAYAYVLIFSMSNLIHSIPPNKPTQKRI